MRSIIARACCFVYTCSCSKIEALRSAMTTRSAASFDTVSMISLTACLNAPCNLVSTASTFCWNEFISNLVLRYVTLWDFCAPPAAVEYLCEDYLPPRHKLKNPNNRLILYNDLFRSTILLFTLPMLLHFLVV